MDTRVLVLGAGFGGLELAAVLSAELGAEADVTLVDRADSFVFGYSKLDLMFGRRGPAEVRIPYAELHKPGVRIVREEILAIDPATRAVTTDAGVREAEVLVLALGADYDFAATPGLVAGANEFYTVPGAERTGRKLADFSAGRILIGVCGMPFKCPPAPSEVALLLDEHLRKRGARDACEIALAMPVEIPVPPSPETSEALLAAFAERGVEFLPSRRIAAVEDERGVALVEGGEELAFDLFLGVPWHRAPAVVLESGLTGPDGYVLVDPRTLATDHPGVYAIGDVATVGVPKAGVFAEGEGRAVAAAIVARARGEAAPPPYDGSGSCYVEFGGGRVGRVDVDFLSGPKPTNVFQEPSAALVAEKSEFGLSRKKRWFGS
jgi:sulfide:quinone oxidoreductase